MSIASERQLRTVTAMVKEGPVGQFEEDINQGDGRWHWKARPKSENIIHPAADKRGIRLMRQFEYRTNRLYKKLTENLAQLMDIAARIRLV
jgi:hypothetical protein